METTYVLKLTWYIPILVVALALLKVSNSIRSAATFKRISFWNNITSWVLFAVVTRTEACLRF
jgi:hypothetical protein